jgi:type II secretory pathway component GspD/PulD (secretin)
MSGLGGSLPAPAQSASDAEGTSVAASIAGRARVIADVNTNSVIVVGDLAVQTLYEGLIHKLDQRRPQVVIETTLVILDTSHNFTLGVEIAKTSGSDPQVLTFSSFGLSTVDKTTGRLTISPSIGFNGVVFSPHVADIIVQALEKTGRAKVLSAPKILVNDNATGRISSTVQQPYQSVNASTTVATTSFGGFVEAGTAIQVTPHISNDNHLQLEYSIELSSFQGQAAQNLPPPRAQNTVQSTVMLPDGDTIVTGGLSRQDVNHSIDQVPLLGDIPLLGGLFRSEVDSDAKSTLFVFIRPVVLRDDRFADLKDLSEQDRVKAGIPSDLPQSNPKLIP